MTQGTASPFEREVRDVLVKSGLTGVAATVLAVTIFSPAGFGGMIGTSVASSFGGDAGAGAAENPYANLPAYPAPLSNEEVSDIRGALATTAASMEITRAATDGRIERMRSIAANNSASAPTPLPALPILAPAPVAEVVQELAAAPAELRLALSEPVELIEPAGAPETASFTPVSYVAAGGSDYSEPYHGSHMELADLLFADENF